jgi:hypothetical protein
MMRIINIFRSVEFSEISAIKKACNWGGITSLRLDLSQRLLEFRITKMITTAMES